MALRSNKYPKAPRPIVRKSQPKSNILTKEIHSLTPREFKILGITKICSDEARKLVFYHQTRQGNRLVQIPVTEMATGEMKQLAAVLAEAGHFDLLERKLLKAVSMEMLSTAHKNDVVLLSGPGVHFVEDSEATCSAYVWGGTTYWFGDQPKHSFPIVSDCKELDISGSLKDWQVNVGKRLAGNHFLIVLVAQSLAAAISSIFHVPRLTMILVGPSSTGKTTSQRCAQSMLGSCVEVRTMSGTPIGIREHLLSKSDVPVFFQDTRQFTPEDLIALIFDVADGATRLKSGAKYESISATMILSNERNIVDMASTGKLALDEGIFARSIEVECDAEFGAFHNIHGAGSPAQFAKELEDATAKYQGAVWPFWLRKLSENWDIVLKRHSEWLPKVKGLLAKKAGDASQLRINNRILDKLSFAAWTGVVAAKMGILPLERTEIIEAFAVVLRQSIAQQESGSTPLARRVVSQVKGYLDEHGARFPKLALCNQAQPGAALSGYKVASKTHGELFLFLPHVFQRLFVKEFGSVTYKVLLDAGYLVTNSGRVNQYQSRIPRCDKRMSFIAIKASIRFS